MVHRYDYKFLVLVVSVSNLCLAVEKHWMPDLEWQTASNWMDNRVPEIDSQVIFPLETRHAVGIAKTSDLRFAEIDLARSGSLLLARDGKLEIIQRKSSTKTSKWKREGHLFWADPENWNGTTDAAPHFERVPCRQDDIVLPGINRTFSVLMPMRDVQVRSVRISGQSQPFTSWQWDNLRNRREFDRRRFTVKYSEYSCEKCKCQEDLRADYLEEICAIERPRCGLPACEYPLRVEGHCCDYCGGRLSIPEQASLAQIRMLMSEALEGYERKVSWYLRRRWDGATEVLFKEKGAYSGIDIIEAVENARSALLGAGVEILNTETAGAAMQDSRLAVALGPLFGAPLIVLLILLLGFLYFGYSLRQVMSGCRDMFSSVREGVRVEKAQPGKPFGFARFENVPEGTIRIAEAEYPTADNDNPSEGESPAPSGGRFENPLYRSKRRKGEEEEMLNMDEPLSLSTLNERASDPIEEVEMNIDQ